MVGAVKSVELRRRAKFCRNRSNRGRDMTIFRFFQDGGRPPSWICYVCVWTTHEGHLVVFQVNVFSSKSSSGQKQQFWANFDFLGLLYQPPFTNEGQIWCIIADPRNMLTCQISSRLVYSVALCRRKTPIFPVLVLQHLVVSLIGSSLRKLKTGAQLQTFPYPTVSKSFLKSNGFIAKSAQNL